MNEDSSNFLDFKKRQIRSYFFSLQKDLTESQKGKIPITYVHLRLPVDKITPSFENKIQNELEKNYLKINVREAKVGDLKSVLHIYNMAWSNLKDPHGNMTLGSLKKVFNSPGVEILMASVYGMDVGFIILDFEGTHNQYGIIAGLGILPRFQGKGIGKSLGLATWRYFKQKDVKELRCEVFIENKHSHRFIKSLGFEEYKTTIYSMEDFELKKDESD